MTGHEQLDLTGEQAEERVRERAGGAPKPSPRAEERGPGVESGEHRGGDATTRRRSGSRSGAGELLHVAVDGKCLSPPRAGVARYLEGLLAGLDEIGAPDLHLELLRPARARRTLFWVLWDLQRASGRGFSLAHFPFYYPPLAPRCPYTVAVHDVLVLEHPEWFGRPLANPIRLLTGRGARRAAAVIASGETQAAAIAARCRVPRERIHAIPYGVDHTLFAPPPQEAVAAAMARHALEAPYLLLVGAREPRRGADLAIAAAAALRDGGLAVTLALAGEARAPVAALAAPPPWVRLLGRVADEELPALYAGAAALLAPSRGEGFDLPVLEALACGAVVVASDIAVHREHFAGAVEPFASGNAAAFAAACRRVLAEPERAAALRAAGRACAARFTWREAARRHLELWRAVARR